MELTGTIPHTVLRVTGNTAQQVDDLLAVEEPLQISLQLHSVTGRLDKNIAVTMRTPGQDKELALGFLFTDGIINNLAQVAAVAESKKDGNAVSVILKENVLPVLNKAERNFYTTSSCGVCGKASIDAVRLTLPTYQQSEFSISAALLYTLPDALRKEQALFEYTGGLHAVALFDATGKLLLLKEDAGRHNAMDKLVGAALLGNLLPLQGMILLLSGRASFELLQKAAMAGIEVVVAVGAPSSLAVELAMEAGITLVGFLKKARFNVYCGEHRIKLSS